MKQETIYQFRVELLNIEPLIWRLIEVPSSYSFWDLHVAIQDAMGWLDCHLHTFFIRPARKDKPILIGIPDEHDDNILPGWDMPITQFFKELGDELRYDYDFGDNWEHKLVLTGMLLPNEGEKYPRCVSGKRACPPEDCGGIPGYYHLVEVLADSGHEEYEDLVSWLSGYAKNDYPYNPESFNSNEIVFSNPKTRLRNAFS